MPCSERYHTAYAETLRTIKESGRTTYETFGEYFITSGAVPSEYRDMINDETYFATDEFSKSNDAKLESGYTCTSKFYPDSYFCEKGQTYDVSGSFGYKSKASSKYINGRSSRYMNTYTLGNTESNEEVKISSWLKYSENHFWWRTPESYTFSKTYVADYALFRQDNIPVFANYTSCDYSAKMAKLYKHDSNLYDFSRGKYVRTDTPYDKNS